MDSQEMLALVRNKVVPENCAYIRRFLTAEDIPELQIGDLVEMRGSVNEEPISWWEAEVSKIEGTQITINWRNRHWRNEFPDFVVCSKELSVNQKANICDLRLGHRRKSKPITKAHIPTTWKELPSCI